MATDERRVICEDAGDRLVIRTIEGSVEVFIEDIVDGGKRPGEVFISDDKVAVAAAFVDALSLEPCEGGFRAKPRPFRVGDDVRHTDGSEATIRYPGERLLLVVDDDGYEEAWDRAYCTLITPAEEVERGTEEEAADAAATEQAEPVEHRRCHDDDGAGNCCTLTVGHDGLHASVGVLSGTTWARWSA